MNDELARWLTLFAQALADRPLLVEPADEPGASIGRDRGVLTDPTTVRVAVDAGRHRVAVLRQVGSLLFGTTEADPDALAELSAFGRRVFLALEDRRVDATIAREFPGARTELAAAQLVDVTDRVDELVVPFAGEVTHPAATVDDSLRIALAIDAVAGQAELTATPIGAEELAELLGESAPEGRGGFSLEMPEGEVMPATEMLDGATLDVLGELRVDIEASQSGGSGTVVPDLAGDALAAPTSELDEQARAPGPPAPALPRRPPSTGEQVFVYDEWDHLDRRYLRAWCHVTEQRLRGDDMAFIGDVRRRHAVLASQVKRRFAFARSEGWKRVHRTTDGDELEIDAVIGSMVDRRAGYVGDDRLYVRRDRAAREVATAFLCDLSASTGSPIVEPPPIVFPGDDTEEKPEPVIEYRWVLDDLDELPVDPSRRVIDIAKESLALMSDALQVLGDRHAVYGFSGEGRANVEFQIAKDFDDPVSMRTWAALAAMKPRRYTRMGPAIRHAAAKLHREAVRTKLLIVLSDGYPQDVDYGPVRGDKEYGVQDTARALAEAEAMGIATFCVTIDPAGHDYLRRMSPESHYLVIDDVTALPGELMKLYRALTSFAPRRTAPRT